MWVVPTFGINCSFSFGHATESSFPCGDVLAMSDAVGGRLNGRKNQFLLHDYVESNLKKHKYRMTTVIKSKDLLPQRGVVMMSLCPTMLYSQQVSNTRERNRSMARRLNCNLCPSTTVQASCFALFFSLKAQNNA